MSGHHRPRAGKNSAGLRLPCLGRICGPLLSSLSDRSHYWNIPHRRRSEVMSDTGNTAPIDLDPPDTADTPEHFRQAGRPPRPSPFCPLCGGRTFRHWSEKLKRWVLTCQGDPWCYVCIGCMEWRRGGDKLHPECIECGEIEESLPTCAICAKEWVCFACDPGPRNQHRIN